MDKQAGKAIAEIIMPLIADNKRIKGCGDVAFLPTKAKSGMKSVPPLPRVSVLAAGARKHLLSPVGEYGPLFLIYLSPWCSELQILFTKTLFFHLHEVNRLLWSCLFLIYLIYLFISAIPLSTLAADSQFPLHSVQCTQKQLSLKPEVPSCETPATIHRKTIILASDAVSEQQGILTWDTAHPTESKDQAPQDIQVVISPGSCLAR